MWQTNETTDFYDIHVIDSTTNLLNEGSELRANLAELEFN